jgi:hypothetical protein
MKQNLVGTLVVLLALLAFDQFGTTSWHLAERLWEHAPEEAVRWILGSIALGLIAVSSALISSGKEHLGHGLGDLLGRRRPSILDDRVRPVAGAKPWQWAWGLWVSLWALALATGIIWLSHALPVPDKAWVLLVCVVAVVLLFSHRFSVAQGHFELQAEGVPGACETLILFLSDNLNLKGTPPEHPLAGMPRSGLPDERELIAAFSAVPKRDNWLMPLLSIRHQLEEGRKVGQCCLRRVLLIPSETTHGHVAAFRQVVDAWLPGHGLEIEAVAEDGVGYINPQPLWAAINQAYRRASELGAEQVILDLTSGTAQCSAAGAVASLEPGRMFKYVNTNTYQQHAYRIAHVVHAAELGH